MKKKGKKRKREGEAEPVAFLLLFCGSLFVSL